jgi:hypothetical protein
MEPPSAATFQQRHMKRFSLTNELATVAFRTYEWRELERRWADPRRGGKYRARGRKIRKEGYRRVLGITPLCVCRRTCLGRFGLPGIL